jgi:predicted permease
VDAGFHPHHLVTFGINLPAAPYQDAARRAQFAEALARNLRSIPGVEAVSPVTGLPPNRPVNPNLTDLENLAPPPGMPGHTVDYNNFAGIEYFETMRIPIVKGRGFNTGDISGPPVVVINEAMARQFYAAVDPIGRRLRPTSPPLPAGTPDTLPWFTIVGVAKDVKQGGLDQKTGTEIYYDIEQGPRVNGVAQGAFNIAIRSPLAVNALEAPIESVVRSMDRALPVIQLRSMETVFGDSVSRQRFLSMLLGLFALVALTLAAVGTYGVLSYIVTERRREIGIRVALGASNGEIVRLVLGQGIQWAVNGIAIGLVGAVALAYGSRTLLFAVSPTDPITFVGVAMILFVVALVASVVPARRALRIDPLEAIRND